MTKEELQNLQPQIYQYFLNVLERERLHHAYLFSGNFGSFEMSLFLAQSLFCTEKVGVESCGQCRSCKLIASEEFSDVTIVRPSNQIIKTERVRDLVKDFSRSGVEGSKQVFIIVDSDKMHVNAANSLLKVIEEPQSEVYIFLLTANEQKVLPTIKSRTQKVRFPKQEALLSDYLERTGLLKTQANLLAGFAQSMKEAESLSKSTVFFDLVQELERFTKLLLNQEATAFLQVAKLSQLCDEKEKQSQAFRLLELLLASQLELKQNRLFLDKLVLAREMWSANVSFQNALEYMVLT
ncbi:DNA polymerase III subunit delta' [Streptococcus sp. DD10]|uniref:DNA polymerase III subunit delta' n=1 Tax=Streptococcus sp. DD10 TaxID=1777878 RepID=UPI0012E844CD|nr:DNA polymerase III subunit delta' [Streptococcus sp. DD10]